MVVGGENFVFIGGSGVKEVEDGGYEIGDGVGGGVGGGGGGVGIVLGGEFLEEGEGWGEVGVIEEM